jgi:hypothetical protein
VYFSLALPRSLAIIPSALWEAPGGDLTPTRGRIDSMAKKKLAFGGYSINFKGCKDTMESVMGSSPIGPSEMTKKIWGYVKRKRLAKK